MRSWVCEVSSHRKNDKIDEITGLYREVKMLTLASNILEGMFYGVVTRQMLLVDGRHIYY